MQEALANKPRFKVLNLVTQFSSILSFFLSFLVKALVSRGRIGAKFKYILQALPSATPGA